MFFSLALLCKFHDTFKTGLTDCSIIRLRVPRPDTFLLSVHLTETFCLRVERDSRFTTLASDPKAESKNSIAVSRTLALLSTRKNGVEGLCHTRILLRGNVNSVLKSLLSV